MNYHSVTPCPAGLSPPIDETITSNTAGPSGGYAFLGVDYTQKNYQFIALPLAGVTHDHRENDGCTSGVTVDGDIPAGTIGIGLANPDGFPMFSLPDSPQTLSQMNLTFQAQAQISGPLLVDWTLTLELTPECIVPEGEITDFVGWFTVAPPRFAY